jgi:hypothetical protein
MVLQPSQKEQNDSLLKLMIDLIGMEIYKSLPLVNSVNIKNGK